MIAAVVKRKNDAAELPNVYPYIVEDTRNRSVWIRISKENGFCISQGSSTWNIGSKCDRMSVWDKQHAVFDGEVVLSNR